jgi:two-component system, OmpR family, sensor histidine kinase VicK
MATHELRTPLTSVKGYAQLLRRRAAYSPAAVEAILTQAEQMERLVSDLQDASTIRAGRLDLQRSRLDLVDQARAVVDQLQLSTELHRLSVLAPASPVLLAADPVRLRQVLTNLLTNALKYSPDGGDVTVRIEPAQSSCRVSVADQGVGISPSVLPRLFDRFFRDNSTATNASGLGLGLYIARGIVEAHGGHLTVESTLGQGSTFHFTLPTSSTPT